MLKKKGLRSKSLWVGRVRKASLTLLEVAIAFSILTVAGGFCALKGAALIATYRINTELQEFKQLLAHARTLSFTLRSDITIDLSNRPKGCALHMKTDEAICGVLKRAFPAKPTQFKSLSLHENTPSRLRFSGTGWVFPEKDLEIIDSKGRIYRMQLINNK